MKSRSICPSCKAVLEFDRAVISVVKCPKCNFKGNVTDFKQFKKQEESDPTEVNGDLPCNTLCKPGKLEWMECESEWMQEEKTVNLQCGINTIGRMSPNSTSIIQLPVTDSFMSKSHTTIEVIMKANGVFEHRLSDMGSKNGTFHNGDRLETGDVIKLIQGDIIKMGNTVLKFIVE